MDHIKDRKCESKRKCTDIEYHVQDIKYVSHISVKMSCITTQFTAFACCDLHEKLCVVRGLSRHHNIQIDTKLGHGNCTLRKTPYACIASTTMWDNPWAYKVEPNKQTRLPTCC